MAFAVRVEIAVTAPGVAWLDVGSVLSLVAERSGPPPPEPPRLALGQRSRGDGSPVTVALPLLRNRIGSACDDLAT
jgi:hypothetical protein